MGPLVRLRISLADRAGALAQAATIIGLHGGNIMSIDVHTTGGDSAIDDLVVDFSAEPEIDDLREDLALNAATRLLSFEETETVDPMVSTIAAITEMVSAHPPSWPDALIRGIAIICPGAIAWVSDEDGAAIHEAGRLAMEQLSPAVTERTRTPEQVSGQITGDVCLLAVPNLGDSSRLRIVFVARTAEVAFTITEVARIEALTGFVNQLEGLYRAL